MTKKISSKNIIEAIDIDYLFNLIEQFLSDNYSFSDFNWTILNAPKSQILISEEEFDGEYYKEEIHYNDIITVNQINGKLSKIDISKLRKVFFSWNITNREIYKIQPVGEDTFKDLYNNLTKLIEFYKNAAKDNNFVIVVIE